MDKDIFALRIREVFMPNFEPIAKDAMAKIMPLFDTDPAELQHDFALNGGLSLYYKYNRLADQLDLKEIIQFVNEQAQLYWKSLNYSQYLTPYVLNSWANITPPGANWGSHNHSPAPLAGVIYLNANPSMGNLVLEHPLDTVLSCQPYEFDFKPKLFDYEIKSETGKLVLFPGYLKHKTQLNPSNDLRLVIGFNIGCRGQVNYLHYF